MDTAVGWALLAGQLIATVILYRALKATPRPQDRLPWRLSRRYRVWQWVYCAVSFGVLIALILTDNWAGVSLLNIFGVTYLAAVMREHNPQPRPPSRLL